MEPLDVLTLTRLRSDSPFLRALVNRVQVFVHAVDQFFHGIVKPSKEQTKKKRKKQNHNPKHPDRVCYRDLKRQNEWLKGIVFDAMGNYLYCCVCIRISLRVSKQQLANQKRQQSQAPIVETKKCEVEAKRLGEYVIMPDEVQSAFSAWWRSVSADTVVRVRFPH